MAIVTHRAKWVMITPERIAENGYVTVSGDRIVATGWGKVPKDVPVVDHGAGMLMSPLVNAHTHLDLTPLEEAVSAEGDFLAWVHGVIAGKAALTNEKVRAGILEGEKRIHQSGCALAGDHRSFPLQTRSPETPIIHVFYEYLGTTFPGTIPETDGEPFSLAAHAPHTTAPGLIQELKQWCRTRGRVFSIHVAESPDEVEFITRGSGRWADFLESRGTPSQGWGPLAPSPVRHLDRLGVLDSGTMAVHLVQASKDDLEILAQKGVRVCVCPRSNRNLLGKLPNVRVMMDMGLRPALGTDSLASVSSLDLFDEMSFLAREVPALSPAEILSMGTLNGARALGRDKDMGTLENGKQGTMLFLPVEGTNGEAAVENLLSGDFQISPQWVF